MKYEVGDRVKHEEYGVGTVVHTENQKLPYAIRFDNYHNNLYDLGIFGAPIVRNGHGCWCSENELTPFEENKNQKTHTAKAGDRVGCQFFNEAEIKFIGKHFVICEDDRGEEYVVDHTEYNFWLPVDIEFGGENK